MSYSSLNTEKLLQEAKEKHIPNPENYTRTQLIAALECSSHEGRVTKGHLKKLPSDLFRLMLHTETGLKIFLLPYERGKRLEHTLKTHGPRTLRVHGRKDPKYALPIVTHIEAL